MSDGDAAAGTPIKTLSPSIFAFPTSFPEVITKLSESQLMPLEAIYTICSHIRSFGRGRLPQKGL